MAIKDSTTLEQGGDMKDPAEASAPTEFTPAQQNIHPGHTTTGAPDDPWIVCRNVNDLRVCRFDDDRLTFSHYLHRVSVSRAVRCDPGRCCHRRFSDWIVRWFRLGMACLGMRLGEPNGCLQSQHIHFEQ